MDASSLHSGPYQIRWILMCLIFYSAILFSSTSLPYFSLFCPSSSVERSPRLLSSRSLTVSLSTVPSLFLTVTHSSHDSLLSRHPLVYSNLLHSRLWRRQEGWHTVAFLSRLGCIQKPPTKSVMKPPPGGAKAPGAPSPAAPSPAPGGEKKEVR